MRPIAQKGRSSGEGTVRTRKDGRKEACLLVPKEYRAAVGRTCLYFYGKTEREAKRKRSNALRDLIQRGPKAFDANRITFGEWLERWIEKKERPTLDLEALSRFFEAAAGERLEALWIVWCLTGLRPGEVLGLKWPDVRLAGDGQEDELLVRRSWSATRTGAVMRETTKTGQGRPVSLLSEAAAALKLHRTRYLEELVKYRTLWETAWAKNPEYRDLVFPSKAGTPLDHGNVNRQQFKRLLKKAALPPMRPYDIRHSFATTINTYSHLSPRYQRESFGRFGDALGGR